jgi:hypothetical protein
MTSTEHRYQPGDAVHAPGWPGMSTILGAISHRDAELEGFGPVTDPPPLYVVNEGNVFGCGGRYEALYPESDLEPWVDGELVEPPPF